MSKHKYRAHLSPQSINGLIDELKAYQSDLDRKCELFVSKLIEVGIRTAKANTGEYGDYIVFSKQLEPHKYGCTGIMVAYDGQKILRSWKYKGATKIVEVSPLLMAEFGSGWKANNGFWNLPGVGQGTFPGQKHAFDVNGWYWTDLNGKTHHSRGEAPTYPLFSASFEMIFEMNRIAREVFK